MVVMTPSWKNIRWSIFNIEDYTDIKEGSCLTIRLFRFIYEFQISSKKCQYTTKISFKSIIVKQWLKQTFEELHIPPSVYASKGLVVLSHFIQEVNPQKLVLWKKLWINHPGGYILMVHHKEP